MYEFKNTINNSSRNYGVDLLKILAMLMVLALHLLGFGGLLSTEKLTFTYSFSWLIECMSMCAVNCFALVSGFVNGGSKTKYRYSSILYLWLRVVFWMLIITLCFWLYDDNLVEKADLIRCFFPVLTQQYWFFTAYFCMFCFIPVYNYLIHGLKKGQLEWLITSFVILFSFMPIMSMILPDVFSKDPFNTREGYSALWLAVLYIVGGYIRKYDLNKNISKFKCILVYFICVIFVWGIKIVSEYTTLATIDQAIDYVSALRSYTSPFIIGASIALLVLFSNIEINRFGSVISFVSILSFSVYIIHMQPLIKDNILPNSTSWIAEYGGFSMLIFIAVLFAVFIVLIGVDALREILFRKMRIKEFCIRIECSVFNIIYKARNTIS